MAELEKAVVLPIDKCDLKVRVGRDGVWLEFGPYAAIHVHNKLGSRQGIIGRGIDHWVAEREEQARKL